MKKKNFKNGALVEIKPGYGFAEHAVGVSCMLHNVSATEVGLRGHAGVYWVRPEHVKLLEPAPAAEAPETPEAQRDGSAPDPFKVMADVLDGWISGAAENHEALGHRDSDCCSTFTPEDIRRMIDDARNETAATLVQRASKPAAVETLEGGFYVDAEGDLWFVVKGVVVALDVCDGYVSHRDISDGTTIAQFLSSRANRAAPWWPLRKVADLPRGAR